MTVRVYWTLPEDGGSTITSTEIERRLGTDGTWEALPPVQGVAVEAVDESGTDNHQYRARAVNVKGPALAWSNIALVEVVEPVPATVVSGTVDSGTQITWTWTAVTDATKYEYRVNGGTWVDSGLTRTFVQTVTAGSTSTLEVRTTTPQGTSMSEPVSRTTTAPPAQTTYRIQDSTMGTTNNTVQYNRTWNVYEGDAADDGSFRFSGVANDTVTIRFTGNAIAFHGTKEYGNGIVAYSIDGGPEQTASCFGFGRTAQAEIFKVTGLTNAPHTLVARVTGQTTGEGGSTGTSACLDYCLVTANAT